MTRAAPDLDWNSFAATPLARLRAIRDYANRVFDDETRAATWLGRAHKAVGSGLCAVGAACYSDEGFREAVAELGRIERTLIGVAAQAARATAPGRGEARV